jgi:threonyl-tRNA synthetase
VRGYTEVTTPNIFNMQLWNISGHAQNYKQNMFVFEVEKQEYRPPPLTTTPLLCIKRPSREGTR